MFILSIGNHHFAIPSAAIAAAVRDLLSQSPQVFLAANCPPPDGQIWWQVQRESEIGITSVNADRVVCSRVYPIPANVAAVLGEPTASRARTHQILSLAAADHSRAVADHHNKQN